MRTLPSPSCPAATDPAQALHAPAPLHAITVEVPRTLEGLLAEAVPDTALAFVRGGEGLVGHGTAAVAYARGPERIATLRTWFARVTAGATVQDEVGRPGTGLAAFATFAFSHASDIPSRLVIPEIVLGADPHGAWLTWVTQEPAPTRQGAMARLRALTEDAGAESLPDAAVPAPAPTLSEGRVTSAAYVDAVAAGVARIKGGEAEKIVLGRDALVQLHRPVPVGSLLPTLAERFPTCWVYSLDGLFGATPEMLVQVRSGAVHARVLAGTLDREGVDAAGAEAARAGLLADHKQREEHGYAIDSLTRTLGPLVTSLQAPEEPFVLELPNVWHLASDVSAELAVGPDGRRAGVLDLVQVVHPTAAVCGTPRADAERIIRELEGADRGHFAGPVGWVDAAGNGEFGIALRGGAVQADGNSVRVWAGCGIVAESVPEEELAETRAKLRPMLTALGV